MARAVATTDAQDAYESERVEALAWEDLASAAASQTGLQGVRDGQALALHCVLPFGLFNRVIGLGTLDRASAEQLERLLRVYRQRQRAPIVHLGDGPDAPWLREVLAAHGFCLYPRSWIKLVRGAGLVQAARTTLDIAPASGRAEAAEAGEVLAQAFGLPLETAAIFAGSAQRPRWHLLVARDAGRVVAAATLFVADASGYLMSAGTLPSHRGRGAQAALIERRVRIALALGCTRLFCETGEAIEGRPQTSGDNLLRAGFRPLAVRPNWASPGARL